MNTINVLIIEDDFMVARINRAVTEKMEGFSVADAVLTGEAGLNALAKGGIDLVILDIYLPDMNGLELLKEARRREYIVDFILVTAAYDGQTVKDAVRYGIVDYLIKPFDFDRYRTALGEYRRRQAVFITSGQFDQLHLDNILTNRKPDDSAEKPPKGISPLTLERVTSAVAAYGADIGAEDLAAQLSISRITARRYLEFLADKGYLRRDLKYQKIGRPIVRYAKDRL
jgi:two-component system, CitB family, response regulator MalR